MAYVVQAEESADHAPASKTLAERKKALATAIKWASQGRSNIKIIGDGRIYTPKEFVRVIIEQELSSRGQRQRARWMRSHGAATRSRD